MIGYKNSIFQNVGWFGANCDKILNYIPARLTAFVMVLSAMIVGVDWKKLIPNHEKGWNKNRIT